jgi:hypothetical protein
MVAQVEQSYTGRYLSRYFKPSAPAARKPRRKSKRAALAAR